MHRNWSEYLTTVFDQSVRRPLVSPSHQHPSKHKTFLYHLYKVGPTSSTLVQHCTNVIQMFRVCWDQTRRASYTSRWSQFAPNLINGLYMKMASVGDGRGCDLQGGMCPPGPGQGGGSALTPPHTPPPSSTDPYKIPTAAGILSLSLIPTSGSVVNYLFMRNMYIYKIII